MNILSIHDSIQEKICARLAYTEYMLAEVLKKINNAPCKIEITALEDLGFANNITRMRGGFFTGINVKWKSDIPFVPVDTTVNSCGVSIFKFEGNITYQSFRERIKKLDLQLISNGEINNFNRGNHFIAICSDSNGKQYLVIHASDNKYKFGHRGLYPREDTWFFNKIQTDYFSNGYIRYLVGEVAEKFYGLYLDAEKSNPIRNRFVAELILEGCSNVEEVLYSPHYGMPDNSSVSIGSQWKNPISILLSREGAPIYLIKENKPICNYMPHGFGLTINGNCNTLSFTDSEIVINDLRFNCEDGFMDSKITSTRNSDIEVNYETLNWFMPLRSVVILNELRQRFSYTRNGIKSFE